MADLRYIRRGVATLELSPLPLRIVLHFCTGSLLSNARTRNARDQVQGPRNAGRYSTVRAGCLRQTFPSSLHFPGLDQFPSTVIQSG